MPAASATATARRRPRQGRAEVVVDFGPGGAPARFARPVRVIRADRPDEVDAALDAADRALAEGRWLAGLLSYELGYALEPRLAPLMPEGRRLPLLALGVFDGPEPAGAPGNPETDPERDPGTDRVTGRVAAATPGHLSAPRPLWDAATHAHAAARVLDLIAAGDIYQANLTFPMRARWSGTPEGIAAALARRQPVGHAARLSLPGLPAILSRSPELFFRIDAAGVIETRPMKGTAPRGATPEADAALRDALAQSVKNRAENLMIVDLLRNDISRVCRPGSVRVPALYAVETYATVHQMISRVTGQLMPGTRFSAILRALFPCGSVTGAPKIRAMEVIRALEAGPRGAYCGALGWMAPDGRGDFNVAIRTLTLWPGGEAELWVGGGIVADSTPEAEWEEALWKARFAAPTRG